MRFSPGRYERLVRSNNLHMEMGGAELNVLSGCGALDMTSALISVVPDNDLGLFAARTVRFDRIDNSYIYFDKSENSRIGTYFYENGSYPRKPRITYDRRHSSFGKIDPDVFPDEMYTQTRCFHTTGITMALTGQTREATIEMIKRFKKAGALISFDVNFRANLWDGPTAKKYIEQILPYVDVFFCSKSTAELTFLKSGSIYDIMRSFTEEYPISIVASTDRIVHSPKYHTFSSVIYDARKKEYYEEEPYRNIEVIDRIGSGDAYITGALYGIIKKDNCRIAMEYGNATSSLKNTVMGDSQIFFREEIEDMIQDHLCGGGGREMKR